jgi:ABC-type protease/lipase transport system fused ATPase/permease subunit
MRQLLQIVMLGVGAWLVIEFDASAGIMVAATLLLARALQPVEYLIGGWKALIDARAAWQRLETRKVAHPTESPLGCRLRPAASTSTA